MNTDNIILRELINSPLTTKGDFLTNEDFDNNNINIYNDLVALCNTSGVIAFDEFETYDDTVLNYSTYGGRLYEYVNASPSIGVTPSTDTSYWLEVFPAILAHKRNADTVLNEGGADEVTAAEIRAFIDAGLTTTTNLAITTKTANTFLLTSSTGADVTIPAATRIEAGLMIATDKSKIDQVSGINTGDQSLISLGAEATANKATVFTILNDVLFPTVQAVETRIVAKIDALINAAPAALDTLNELAAALGDDANFATTTTSALATKEATANKQNALTVDGTGVKFPTVDAVNSALALIPSGITIGTTAITSGTTKRVLFQDGSVVSQSANFVFDASNQLVIGGHTGGARIDVKCGGALSTDLGQKWTSSSNTQLGKFTGDGALTIGTYTNPSTKLSIDNGASTGAYIGGLKGIIAVGNASGTAYGIDALGRSTASGGTSYGVNAIADGGTGNAVNYGIRGQASGAGLTNYAGYFDALSATTNYALYVQRGDMAFGVSPTLNKIGFFGVTPIAQPTAVTTPQGIADALTNLGLLASSTIPTDPAGWTTIVKSANQDVTNSATLVDDTDLQFSVVAGGHYMIEMDLVISTSDATTAKFKHSLTLSAGTQKGSGNAISNTLAGSSGVVGMFAFATASSTTSSIGTFLSDVNAGLFSIKIIYSFLASSNAIFKYQFANNTAVVGATSRTWKGSILKYKRID